MREYDSILNMHEFEANKRNLKMKTLDDKHKEEEQPTQRRRKGARTPMIYANYNNKEVRWYVLLKTNEGYSTRLRLPLLWHSNTRKFRSVCETRVAL